MEIVDFYGTSFGQIPEQDNPAFGNECLMIVSDTMHKSQAVVLHIVPDPVESVNRIAVFFDINRAREYCESFKG